LDALALAPSGPGWLWVDLVLNIERVGGQSLIQLGYAPAYALTSALILDLRGALKMIFNWYGKPRTFLDEEVQIGVLDKMGLVFV